jgi:hypothetical protein
MLVLVLPVIARERPHNEEAAKAVAEAAPAPQPQIVVPSDGARADGPLAIVARRFGEKEARANPWRMHGLLLEAQDDWDVQWVNGRAVSTAIGFVRSGPIVEEVVVRARQSIAFFPESLEALHEQYAAESAGFRAVFPTVAALREGFGTDLALFDAIAEMPGEALREPVVLRPQAYLWMRWRSRSIGDIRVKGEGVTVHMQISSSGQPREQLRWIARGAVFDTNGRYRGTLVIRADDLDEAQRATFIALCSDLVARLTFEE